MRYFFKSILFCAILSIFSCTTKNEEKSLATYTFHIDNAVEFADSILSVSKEIVLDTSVVTQLTSNTNFMIDDDRIFCHALTYVYEFDKEGKLISKIGQMGHGKGEYIQVHGVTLNKQDKIVEVLDAQEIYRYDYDGNFLSKESIDLPFSNFVYNDGYYWFASGYNSICGDYNLYKYDKSFNQLEGVGERNMDICMDEDYFGKGTILTYRSSFSHDIYQIIDNKAVIAYTMKFPGLEIPESFQNTSVSNIMQEMESNNFAIIRRFMENERYIFMLIQESNPKSQDLLLYYWIIDKKMKDERIVKFSGLKLDDSNLDSYYLNPQVLDKDNILYFVGCKDNPNIGIYGIDLKLLFSKINKKQ